VVASFLDDHDAQACLRAFRCDHRTPGSGTNDANVADKVQVALNLGELQGM
jgi:hypothetical protein